MRRIAMVCAETGIVLATLLAPAVALVPSNGVYSGVIDNIGEGTGFFRAKGATATKHLVPAGSFTCNGTPCQQNTIVAPSTFACNTLNANLEATSIAVSGTAFDYRGKANFGTSAARMNIRFKGSWQTASKVTGFTRIWDSNCDSGKVHWTITPVS